MSTDGLEEESVIETEDSKKELKQEEETPVLKLRRQLSSLPEVIAKHGAPPEKKENEVRPQVVVGDVPKVDLKKERGEKLEEVEAAVESVKLSLDKFPMMGAKADQLDSSAFATHKQKLVDDKKIVDDQTAITEMEKTRQALGLLNGSLKSKLAILEKPFINQHLASDLGKATTAPVYGGKSAPKNTGAKEFKNRVADPVAKFLSDVDVRIKAGKSLTEEDSAQLHTLRNTAQQFEKQFVEKKEGVDKDKHPHEHQFYTDYAGKCSTVAQLLSNLESTNVPADLIPYRAKKREVEANLAKFDKTRELWKRIDKKTYEGYDLTRTELADSLKDTCADIADDSPAKDVTLATSRLDDLSKDVQKATLKLFESKSATDKLDQVVKDMGSKAKSSADVEFVKEAFKARYNVDVFEGDLSKTNVIAFYQVFKMVPDSHTKGNKWLTEVTRTRSLDNFESEYEGDDKLPNPNGKIAMRALRTGGPLLLAQNKIFAPNKVMVENKKGKKVLEKVNQFTWVTLHEIGHAVDASEDFMSNGTNNKIFGDWKKHDESDIKAIVRSELRKEFSNYPADFVNKYVDKLFDKADLNDSDVKEELLRYWTLYVSVAAQRPQDKNTLLDDPGLKAAEKQRLDYENDGWPDVMPPNPPCEMQIALEGNERKLARGLISTILDDRVPLQKAVDALYKTPDSKSKPDWSALAKSKPVGWYKGIRFKEPDGFLKTVKHFLFGTDAWVRSAQMPINGRVYHEGYKDQWYSYSKALGDKHGITEYQFRAPGEFFAECYAAYMMKKLSSGDVFEKLKELDKKAELKNVPTKSSTGG